MQSIDIDLLATVTGGCQCQQPAQTAASASPAPGAESASAAPGGSALGGLQQVLSFFQSPAFQQLLGGIQGLIGSFGGQGAQSAPSAQPASTPAAG